jgi:(S)-sulfolactate dehydrogenase
MANVLITEFMDEAAVDLLRQRHEVTYDAKLVDARAELLALVADADALIVRNRTQVNAEVLEHAPRVRVVGRLGVGLDNLDMAGCAARGIEVIPAVGANADAVSEYVLLAAGALLRGAFFVSAETGAGKWPRGRMSEGCELGGRTLGLLGFGSIGQNLAGKARAFGLRVAAWDALLPADAPAWKALGVQRCDALDDLLGMSDIVSLHLPLVPETRGLLGRERLARMRRGALFVNTARGGIVDEAALAALVKGGHLAGAAVDVFEREPLPAGSPLAGLPNVLLTPHIAGVTQESNVRVSGMIAERVVAALAKLGL